MKMAKDPFRKDPYAKLARRQYQDLQANISAAQADLEAYRQAGDKQSARGALQQIADLTAQQRNLSALHDQYVASKTPQQAPAKTAEEIAATLIQNMTGDELLALYRSCEYGKDLDWNDPNVRAGWVEAQNRRARGE
jgi:hypothetical protein